MLRDPGKNLSNRNFLHKEKEAKNAGLHQMSVNDIRGK